ncbi:glycosyltransferase family 4 protein [Aliikangiella sp. IMCC44359]|uniref:glycosyltransferase family 4 protein n=1 Tax=Aliikangiella sp. IMCC44359 TaxID=3459125 RepID=UPI00403AB62D
MKILIVVPGGVHQSGEIKVIPALLSLFKELSIEHEVYIIALNQHKKLTEYRLYGCNVISLPPTRIRNFVKSYRLVLSRLRYQGFKPDVIHSFWLGAPTLLAAALGRKFKVPLLASIAGGELVNIAEIKYGGAGSFISLLLARFSLLMANASTCGSEFLQAIVINRFGVKPDTVPLGIDIEFWPIKTCNNDTVDSWNLLQLASINRVKDPMLMLNVVKCLKQVDFKFHLNWVGEDTLNGEIQKLAKQMEVSHLINFLDFITQKDLKALLIKQHFVIQTSYYESQGVALAEASSQGVCPVGTDVGWLSDLKLGLNFPRESLAEKIAEQIMMLANDFEKRNDRVMQAQKSVRECNVKVTANKFLTLYQKLQIHSEK